MLVVQRQTREHDYILQTPALAPRKESLIPFPCSHDAPEVRVEEGTELCRSWIWFPRQPKAGDSAELFLWDSVILGMTWVEGEPYHLKISWAEAHSHTETLLACSLGGQAYLQVQQSV